MQWNFFDTGEHTGAFNMRCDERMAKRVAALELAPSVRVFRWKPYCVSLGANQRLNEINAPEAARRGYDIVHRPTGGRAILHAEELTYCVAMPAGGASILESHNEIGKALVAALRRAGIAEAALAPAGESFQRLYKQPSAVACFASAARYEVTVRGKKIVGSAQRRYGDTLLQHGSILIGNKHTELIDLLPEDFPPAAREELREDLLSHTTSLNEEAQRPPDVNELSECLKRGFAETFGCTFINGSVEEIEVVEELGERHCEGVG